MKSTFLLYLFFFKNTLHINNPLHRFLSLPNFEPKKNLNTVFAVQKNKFVCFSNVLKKTNTLFINLFALECNVVFFDTDFNYNYIPGFSNTLLGGRYKDFLKKKNYFNVKCIFFFNVGSKKKLVYRLSKTNNINVFLDKKLHNTTDLNFFRKNNPLRNYCIYIQMLGLYLANFKFKK